MTIAALSGMSPGVQAFQRANTLQFGLGRQHKAHGVTEEFAAEEAAAHEEAGAEQFALAERKKAVAKVELHAKAEIPWFDHIRGTFTTARAKEFADTKFQYRDDPASFTGRELLSFLTTASALNPTALPDKSRLTSKTDPNPNVTARWAVYFEDMGRPEASLRQFAEAKNVPYTIVDGAIRQAKNWGLVYRADDQKMQRTYLGVPELARQALDLKPPVDPKATAATTAPAEALKDAPPTPYQTALKALLSTAADLHPDKYSLGAECVEYAAQIAQASVRDGLLNEADVPKPIRDVIEATGPNEQVDSAILTLVEASSDFTPLSSLALTVGQTAVKQNIVAGSALKQVTQGVKTLELSA